MTGSNEKLIKIFDLNSLESGTCSIYLSWSLIADHLLYIDPVKFSGHSSAVRHALFANDDKWVVSVSDDKTLRFWDRVSEKEIKRVEFNSIPISFELSQDKKILTVCSGNKVSFWDVDSLEKIKEYEMPTQVLSATLHPESKVFVCGGEDFKMYKYNYHDGTEIG